MPTPFSVPNRRRLALLVPLLAAVPLLANVPPVTAAVRSASHAQVPVPHTPRHLPAGIEALPPYQPETFCRTSVEPGVRRVEHLLTGTYHGTAIVSDLRPCVKGVTSEHYDGRALDWGVDHRDRADRADGRALLHWLFATDAAGDRDAMLRRLGIMYVIWNRRIWGAWDQRWKPYACKGVTACHVDHMHLSFDWAGAEAKTSFFTGQVSGPVGSPPHPHHPARHHRSTGRSSIG